jgi:hypothetical protein
MSLSSQIQGPTALLERNPGTHCVDSKACLDGSHEKKKDLAPVGIPAVQPSHYTNHAIPATHLFLCVPLFTPFTTYYIYVFIPPFIL